MTTPTITPQAPASYRVSVTLASSSPLVGFPHARTRAATPATDPDSPVRDALATHADAIADYYRTVFEGDAD